MVDRNRREFLQDVGRGMLVASLGAGLVLDLGLGTLDAADSKERLTFDKLEPLVSLMQETPADKLLPALMTKLQNGMDLKTLVAAGALANARCFGGQDYTGYHAFMALPPALDMANELPEDRKALPVLKVLYRNTARMQAHGGAKNEVLHPITAEVKAEFQAADLVTAARKADMAAAEIVFARANDNDAAFNALQMIIQDEIDVHRVVLSWRAWTMLDIAGREYAHTLLRQSVRFCVDNEQQHRKYNRKPSAIRELLPKLLDENKLAGKPVGTRQPDDKWIEEFSETIYGSGREKAAEAAAMALAEGISPEAVGEAMSVAATRLVLRDPGRERDEEGKPKGSVHGASVGVHASDSVNAWRNIAKVANPRNAMASLIVCAFHTAGQSGRQKKEPAVQRDRIDSRDAPAMLAAIEQAVKNKDQTVACGLTATYGAAGNDAKPLFELFLRYAVSEDGALHAEKYYRTVCEEFARSRPEFRWQHMAALARVTASECGFPAPGYAEACRLLKL